MWVLYDKKVAVFINLILTVFLIAFIKNGYDIYDNLAIEDKDQVTGVFANFTQYEGMGDLAENNPQGREGTDDMSDNSRSAHGAHYGGHGGGNLLNVQLGQGLQGQGQPEQYYGENSMRTGTDNSKDI